MIKDREYFKISQNGVEKEDPESVHLHEGTALQKANESRVERLAQLQEQKKLVDGAASDRERNFYLLEYNNLKKQLEFEERLLGFCNLGFLKEEIVKIFKKTDVETGTINFLMPDRIILDVNLLCSGGYDEKGNIIQLSAPRFWDYEKNPDLFLIFVHKLVHEEVHAVSRSECHGINEAQDGKTAIKTRTGTAELDYKNGMNHRPKTAFLVFEEGVNELITLEVYKEYLKMLFSLQPEERPFKISDEAIKKFQRYADEKSFMYHEGADFIEKLTKQIFSKSGVSKETVLGAIKRAKLEGQKMDSPEMEKFLDDMTYFGFTSELRDAYNTSSLESTFKKMGKE